VHVDPEIVPDDLVAITIDAPDDASEIVDAVSLPLGWERVPDHAACRDIGDAWLREGRSLALRVPSAPIPEEPNVILNPRHAAASSVRVVGERRFFFDPRLLT
jgi:RES domain-containing protein